MRTLQIAFISILIFCSVALYAATLGNAAPTNKSTMSTKAGPSCAFQPGEPFPQKTPDYYEHMRASFNSAASQCQAAGAPQSYIIYLHLLGAESCEHRGCAKQYEEYTRLFGHNWCGYHEDISVNSAHDDIIKAGRDAEKVCQNAENTWFQTNKFDECKKENLTPDQINHCADVFGTALGSVNSPVYP